MYSIVFTYGCEHEWLNYDSKKEANKKFNAHKKRVDEYAAKSIYSSVSMSSVPSTERKRKPMTIWTAFSI